MKLFSTVILGLFIGLLFAFLSGYLSVPNLPLPPLGKILHPSNGLPGNVKSPPSLTVLSPEGGIIITDSVGIPHIKASTIEQIMFSQGYVIARDRLFQLHMIVQAAECKLSEWVGEKAIPIDLANRKKDLQFAAHNAIQSWKNFPKQNVYLEHFTKGINHYIKSLQYTDYPIEFKLLDIHPEPWTAYKTALVYKSMANTLANRHADRQNSSMLAMLGPELFNELYEEGEDGGYPVINSPKKYPPMPASLANKIDNIDTSIYKPTYYEMAPKGVGSNNWVIGSTKSATGRPIFCNDPHLSLSLPSIWYQMQLTTPQFNAYGVAIPGIPGLLMGFNDNIAWGETNVGQDVTDLYRIRYVDDTHQTYYLNGIPTPISYDIDTINVRKSKPVIDTIIRTVFGPIIHQSNDRKHDLAMYWLPSQPVNRSDINTFIDIMRAKNHEEFRTAQKQYTSPAQNFLFAHKDGDIALRVNGDLPMRQVNDGRFVEWGDQSSHLSPGIIPFDQNPEDKNPAQGYLTSSNQRSAHSNFSYYFTGTFEHHRNKAIHQILSQDTTFSIEDMKAMQTNNHSILAAEILPTLLSNVQDTSSVVWKELNAWNYSFTRDSKAATYFNIWKYYVKTMTFDEILAYKDSIDINLPEDWKLIQLLQSDCTNQIFDELYTIEKETCSTIINNAFNAMLKKVTAMENIKWAAYRPVNIYHYLRIPAFSRLNLATDGQADAINAMSSTFGPSWRMIVALGEEMEAYGVYPGGQSGNPLSPHYDDMLKPWLESEYLSLNRYSEEDFDQLIEKSEQ